MKLVALDLDGTTLNKDGKVSEATEKTLNKLHKLGIHPVIATGRVKSALPEDVLSIDGIEYLITSNGAMITELSTGKVIYENCIDENKIEEIIENIKNEDIILEIFAHGKAYIDKKSFDTIDESGLHQWHIEYIKRTREPKEDIFKFIIENKKHIENININIVDDARRLKFKCKMEKITNLTITSSSMRNVEIGGNTTSKATAIDFICKKIGIKREDVVAFGDSQNDIQMLEYAGTSVAMGNAADNVKKLADIVADTNENNGVSKAIEEMLMARAIKEMLKKG